MCDNEDEVEHQRLPKRVHQDPTENSELPPLLPPQPSVSTPLLTAALLKTDSENEVEHESLLKRVCQDSMTDESLMPPPPPRPPPPSIPRLAAAITMSYKENEVERQSSPKHMCQDSNQDEESVSHPLLPPPPPPPQPVSTSNAPPLSPSPAALPQSLMTAVIPASSGTAPLRPFIQNVVSAVNLSCELDLMNITFRTRNSEYNPARFSGVVMRINEPHTTALIFRTGKLVVTGARSEDCANLASRKYARIIQKLGFPVKFVDFKIHNMVATCDLRFPVRLEDLQQMHSQFCSFEPELFPGLVYRLVKPRVVLLIFVNGKLVLTGAKTRKELQEALETMYPIIKSFKKQ